MRTLIILASLVVPITVPKWSLPFKDRTLKPPYHRTVRPCSAVTGNC